MTVHNPVAREAHAALAALRYEELAALRTVVGPGLICDDLRVHRRGRADRSVAADDYEAMMAEREWAIAVTHAALCAAVPRPPWWRRFGLAPAHRAADLAWMTRLALAAVPFGEERGEEPRTRGAALAGIRAAGIDRGTLQLWTQVHGVASVEGWRALLAGTPLPWVVAAEEARQRRPRRLD